MSQKKVRKFKKRKRSRPAGGPRKNPQPNPLEQRRREKIDTPPTNPGVQDVPRSLKEFMKLKELANESTKKTTNRKEQKEKKKMDRKATNDGISFASGRSKDSFKAIHSESNEQLSDEADAIAERTPRKLSIKKKRKVKLEKLKMKRKLKKELKKKEEEDDEAEPDIVKDEIKFGEVVHRPPQISTLPRVVSKPGFQYRPGRADDLLVKSIMKNCEKNSYKNQLCAKRKHLSVSDQRQLEVEKNRAMLMYKNLKMRRTKMKS